MSAASCELDRGHKYPSRGFPARTLLRRKKEGAGHWLVAHRKAEEQRHKNIHKKIHVIHRKYKRDTNESPHGNTLDGPFLLKLHCVDEPSELCSVDISEQNLTSVKPDDLKMFDNIVHIDASVNSLSLGSFSSFVSLRELNLSLNGLYDMTVEAADFPHLEVLDLSYNSVSAEAIIAVGQLPSLKVLHLSGNNLHHLPPDLASSNRDPTAPVGKEDNSQFKCLEVLMLDDNKLSSGVFNSVANLPRLKYLNLQGNCISQIPYLQPMEKSSVRERAEEEETLAHNEPNPSAEEHFQRLSQIFPEEEHCSGSSLPFPRLQILNLADNKIAEEDTVMAVALFPMLQEIDIHSNPLTTQRSGDPPLLTYYLQERLGIAIKRKKTEEAVKVPLKVSTDPKYKVDERKPKVPKKMLTTETSCPALTQVGRSVTPDGETPEPLRETPEDAQPFFVTEATDGPEFEFDLQETAENKKTQEDDAVSKNLTCCEMLTDVKPNPDVVESVGIQTAVRMLEQALKNLNVYRDSKPQLDSIQTPYREKEKRIKDLPPLKPTKKPSDRVDEMISEIKGRTTITDVPLSSVMRGTGVNNKDYKEAQSLLKDMTTKYKMVHKKTMEQAADVDSDRNTNQSGAAPPPVQKL